MPSGIPQRGFQVETGTRVCTGLDDLGRELIRLRRLAAAAAARLGCRLVASGVAPYRTPGLAAITGQPRYRELARRYGPVVAEAGTCGCHVHVGVPSRDLGVQVLARLRPWLAPLLAVTANSPIAGGHDTGWASWRYLAWSRWPTAVPPAAWPDAAAYDTAVRRLIGRGAALDERSVYFLARLSPRYPTVEVRVADVCLDTGTAVLRRPNGITAMTMIGQRPAEAAGREEPGHWEGDLITGASNRSAIGTLVDRASRYTILLYLPGRHTAEAVRDALIAAFSQLPPRLRRSLTWDQGKEMALHAEVTAALGMPVYFCEKASPWQRPSNENTNGLLRQYFPKGSDLRAHRADDLAAAAAELNARPRKTLGWDTPAGRLGR